MIALAVACGMVAGLGAILAVRGALTAPVHLGDALAALDHRPTGNTQEARPRLRLPLTASQQRLLAMQGRTSTDFMIEKLVWAGTGFALPLVWMATESAFGNSPGLIPLGFSLLGGILGGGGEAVGDPAVTHALLLEVYER